MQQADKKEHIHRETGVRAEMQLLNRVWLNTLWWHIRSFTQIKIWRALVAFFRFFTSFATSERDGEVEPFGVQWEADHEFAFCALENTVSRGATSLQPAKLKYLWKVTLFLHRWDQTSSQQIRQEKHSWRKASNHTWTWFKPRCCLCTCSKCYTPVFFWLNSFLCFHSNIKWVS